MYKKQEWIRVVCGKKGARPDIANMRRNSSPRQEKYRRAKHPTTEQKTFALTKAQELRTHATMRPELKMEGGPELTQEVQWRKRPILTQRRGSQYSATQVRIPTPWGI